MKAQEPGSKTQTTLYLRYPKVINYRENTLLVFIFLTNFKLNIC